MIRKCPVCNAEIEIPYRGGFGLLAKTLVFKKWNEHVINHKESGKIGTLSYFHTVVVVDSNNTTMFRSAG